MAANGQLVFTDVDKVTFKGVGNTSNAVIDTTTGKIGVGVDSPDANLHVLGNCFVSTNFELGGTMTMGTVTVRAQHELSAITATGNTTPHTVEFQNAETGLVTTGNVEVGKELTVAGNVAVGTNKLFVDTVGGTVGIGSTLIDITDNTLSGAGNGLYIHNPVQGGHLLTLGTQRPWVFEQGLSDASTELCLRSLNSGKKFNIQSPDHSNVMTVVATNGGGNVGIGTTDPAYSLDVNGTSRLPNIVSTDYSKQFTQTYSVDFNDLTATDEELSLFQFEPDISTFTIIQGEVSVDILSRRAQTYMHFQSQKIKIKFNFSWDARGVTGSWLVRNIFVDRVKSIGPGGQIIEYPLEVRYKYKGNRSTDPNIPPKVQVYLRYSGSNFLGRFNVNGVYHSNELDYGLSFPSTIFTSDGNTTDTSVDTQMAHDMEYGTVGIGTASPTRNLHVFHPTYGIHRSIYWSEKPGNPATENPIQMGYLGSSDPSHASGAIGLFQNTYEGGTEQEKVRIQANGNSWFDGGNVGIGKTDPAARLHIYPGSDGAFMIGSLGATEATAPMVMRDAGNEQIHFYYGTTKVGSITSTSTNTAFNTSSDYRLKENIVKLTSALDRVNEISVYQFNFISEPTRKVNGFIAHELQSIIPEAVTGVKDEMIEFGVVTRTNDGIVIQKDVKKPEILDEGMEWSVTSSKPNYQGVDQSKLVPLLTRSVQELSIKNDTLETQLNSVLARLDALENA